MIYIESETFTKGEFTQNNSHCSYLSDIFCMFGIYIAFCAFFCRELNGPLLVTPNGWMTTHLKKTDSFSSGKWGNGIKWNTTF